ncbi:Revertant of glycogen synthase kinase mutation [Madurella fahalii]|uniref:Revertant of glycogen synthase kinase mutation n=1 Tax=Madurella fahalii TaxID=1157608 RepID=A0ABQ0GMN0_9PEZI
MLLVHQAGSVKIGEVVRYTVTYRPSADHILPSPEFLYLRIKNTCAIALRAAFVHGPYTLSVAAYPSNFNPNEKFENPRRYGVPEFEPMLKAGAVWNCHLVVPDNIRQTAGEGSSKHGHFGSGPEHDGETVSWIIEVASQVIFSTSAAVHYEILLARDEKSLNLGSVIPVIGGQAQAPQPGRVSDFQQSIGAIRDHPAQLKGVFSKAIHLKVEDTAALWNTPQLPGWDDLGWLRARDVESADAPVEPVMDSGKPDESTRQRPRQKPRQKKVHLVVLTHGLHSNLGADMLFLKESIDAGVKKAKIDAKARRAREREAKKRQTPPKDNALESGPQRSSQNATTDPETERGVNGDGSGRQDDDGEREEDGTDDEDEEVIVRGFSGNATKTERGIKYLGKRLARFVLSMTYPDQPCLPTAKAASEAIAHSLKTASQKKAAEEAHKHSSVHNMASPGGNRLYKFTKISFVGHSLGGLVQMYAVAYIQKHSPRFFDLIEPVNFIAMASPFLGLNHENPLYVKFALDFGLVGRTGQDLGLTWRAPTIARNGWGALVSNLGESAHKRVYGEPQPESKPLLRILPTGPAHKALKKFRSRTVYSNVVNDGIVPLRTSCLLFLDWQGLGRVDKARREAGLVETVVGFGWAELTGANVTTPRLTPWSPAEANDKEEADVTGKSTPTGGDDAHTVPQPPTNATLEDDKQSLRSLTSPYQEAPPPTELENLQSSTTNTANPFAGFLNLFRSETPKPTPTASPKVNKIYKRSQTLRIDGGSAPGSAASSQSRVAALADEAESMSAPPRTSIFESAGDLLNPKLPSVEYLIDPSKRPRTIFHDRIYHPSDIPPPPLKERSSSPLALRRTPRSTSSNNSAQQTTAAAQSEQPLQQPSTRSSINSKDSSQSQRPQLQSKQSTGDESTIHTLPSEPDPEQLEQQDMIDSSQMRVEEKIARAYHRGLSWRKVLVKLEPDAHNNIMVRRMFANAFGWPVVQHLVQAHFSDEATARTRDEDEPGGVERAKALGEGADEQGRETRQDHAGGRKAEGEGERAGRGDEGEHGLGEGGEENDTVGELPLTRSPLLLPSGENPLSIFSSSPAPPRPPLDRLDSVTWSERDWVDSADESDDGGGNGRSSGKKKKEVGVDMNGSRSGSGSGNGKGSNGGGGGDTGLERSSSPLSWNWTEKIVGKGATSRPRSPGNSGKN